MSAQEIAHIEDTSAEKIYRNLHANRVETPLISKKWTEDHLYNSLKRIKLFGGMNSPILIREEVRSLQDQKQIDGQTTTTLVSKSLLAAERYLDSFKIVYKSLAKSDFVFDLETLKSLFPMPYYKAVKKYTKNFDPPYHSIAYSPGVWLQSKSPLTRRCTWTYAVNACNSSAV
jgi:hypothetical protein